MMFSRPLQLSLAPGFSPVSDGAATLNRFSGFPYVGKPLNRLRISVPRNTGLKPGANKSGDLDSEIVNRKS